jgi:hypothetical protein
MARDNKSAPTECSIAKSQEVFDEAIYIVAGSTISRWRNRAHEVNEHAPPKLFLHRRKHIASQLSVTFLKKRDARIERSVFDLVDRIPHFGKPPRRQGHMIGAKPDSGERIERIANAHPLESHIDI